MLWSRCCLITCTWILNQCEFLVPSLNLAVYSCIYGWNDWNISKHSTSWIFPFLVIVIIQLASCYLSPIYKMSLCWIRILSDLLKNICHRWLRASLDFSTLSVFLNRLNIFHWILTVYFPQGIHKLLWLCYIICAIFLLWIGKHLFKYSLIIKWGINLTPFLDFDLW